MSSVWVDFENTPHVLFLEPFIRQLEANGWDVDLSAKPQAQTLELAAARGFRSARIGGGDFRGGVHKIIGGGLRAFQLSAWVMRRGRPQLLLSSSRSAALAAWILRVPSLALLDYEHTALRAHALGAAAVWLPDVLRGVRLPRSLERVACYYPGLKENLYLDRWRVDRAEERRALGVPESDFLVVARPAASTAHYADPESDRVWLASLKSVLGAWPDARVIVSPRSTAQHKDVAEYLPADPRLTVLDRVVPGPGLVVAADLVLGGGGTMNREAAVLGVPVWSTFCGPTPRIDDLLASEGRLRWVRSDRELKAAIDGDRPNRGLGRGPYLDGFTAIWSDIQRLLHLNRTPPRAVSSLIGPCV